MYVCMSVRFRGNVIFSVPIWDIAPIFLCRFPSYMSIYSVNVLSVCLLVMLQKALQLMDVFLLVMGQFIHNSICMISNSERNFVSPFVLERCLFLHPSINQDSLNFMLCSVRIHKYRPAHTQIRFIVTLQRPQRKRWKVACVTS